MATEDKRVGIIRRFLTDWDDPHLVAKTKVAELLDLMLEDFPEPRYEISIFSSEYKKYDGEAVDQWKKRWFGND